MYDYKNYVCLVLFIYFYFLFILFCQSPAVAPLNVTGCFPGWRPLFVMSPYRPLEGGKSKNVGLLGLLVKALQAVSQRKKDTQTENKTKQNNTITYKYLGFDSVLMCKNH